MTQDYRVGETTLLERARDGDELAFGELVEAHRGELRAYCYRMLGSVHDAEDALQDAMLRAWRGLPGFEGRSSVRSWLYSIATNAAVDVIRRRSRRELPVHFSPAAPLGSEVDPPLADSIWLEPFPDRWLTEQDGNSPEARYEQRESVELAFVVALQRLPPLQRAVLILRDVMAFSAAETASQLGTSVPAANSALQRARATMRDKLPDPSQQSVLRSLGEQRTRNIVTRYADALERGDADTLVSMLTSNADWSMPPIPTWFRGREPIRRFLSSFPLTERWKHRTTEANGQLAVAGYIFDADIGEYVPFVIDVLTLRGDKIAAVTGFLIGIPIDQRDCQRTEDARSNDPRSDGLRSEDPRSPALRSAAIFARFGLPAEPPDR
jgi:RNA polymerase sigma-70 factor, ECF subfamily